MSNILGNMPPVFGSGYRGVVPAPSAADVSAQNILRADGTWGAQATSGPLPSQTGNAGELLTTDGTNASWASSLNTFQFGDVTLGTSGPSVKSTLSARAPRQAIVSDGTAGSGATYTIPAFGTSDFTVSVFAKYPSGIGNTTIVGGAGTNSFELTTDSSSTMRPYAFAKNVGAVLQATTAVASNKWTLITYTRASGVGTFYINGVASGSGADTTNYSNPSTKFISDGQTHLSPLIYNRALSASEVVALYEAGAPAGADYPATVAGTDIVTSGNFSSATGWTVGSAWSISGGVATTNGTADAGGATELAQTGKSFKAGQRIRVTFTLGNVSAGGFRIIFYGGSANTLTTIRTASGTYTEEVVLAGSATAFQTIAATPVQLNNGATLDNLSIVPLGLLLAPDAAQAGGGLVWYDTSGNAANITLPASGVSWNVPTSGYVTSGSSLNLSAGGTNQNITLTPSGTGLVRVTCSRATAYSSSLTGDVVIYNPDQTDNGYSSLAFGTRTSAGGVVDTGSAIASITTNHVGASFATQLAFLTRNGSGTLVEAGRFTNGGNFLIGGTIDGGNGNLQLKDTSGSSTKGIGFGTDLSLYRANTGFLILNDASAALDARIGLYNNGIQRGLFEAYNVGTAVYIGAASASWSTIITSGNGTTALTLDSSQNATFAGKITANGAGSTFKGTATNDNAAAGYVGEFVSSAVVSASAVSLTNATAANITSISLTAGDWDVTGLVQYNFTGATCSYVYHGFSSASAAFGAPNSYVQDYRNYTTASVSTHNPSLTFRISLAATTTIYFVTQADFSAGTVAAYGRIQARRVR